MYSFAGHLKNPRRYQNIGKKRLVKLLVNRSKRLAKWYPYVKRNRMMGEALAILFGALELPIMEALRFLSRFIPSIKTRFMKLVDGKWGSKVIPLNVEIKNVSGSVLPSQQIIEIARRSPIRSLNWCYCYSKNGGKSKDGPERYSCLALGWGQNLQAIDALARNDLNKKVSPNLTLEQLEEKLKEWDDQGYVHQVIFFPSPDYFYIICNCHPDWCLTLSNLKKWGFPSVVKSDFINQKDQAKCNDCLICIDRCHFNAIKSDGKGRMQLNQNNCAGCGLCVSKCPEGALQLVPRKKPENNKS
ncbi:MAG: ATP-binding protein [Candidatus Hodarchaeota archaeon]